MAKEIIADELFLRSMGLVPFDERDKAAAKAEPAKAEPVKQPAATTPKPQKPKAAAKTAPAKPKLNAEKAPVVKAAAKEPEEIQIFSVRMPVSLVEQIEDIAYKRNKGARKRDEKYTRQQFIREAIEEKLAREKK